MRKRIHGYCPVQDEEYTISVNYIDASTLKERVCIKGTYYCEYNKYGDQCNEQECPIYKLSPEVLS